MGKHQKLLWRILRGRSDADIGFDDLRNILLRAGFVERVSSSHHNFRKPGVDEKLNLQRGKDGKAKPYQVRQVRNVLLEYKLVEVE